MVEIISIIVALVLAVVLHEYAHGWVAYKLGDPTAKLAGRLTINPIRHIDPVGTVFLPGVLVTLRLLGLSDFPPIGWAKPVPVNFSRLNNPRRDMILVGLAGPAVNIALVIIFSQLVLLPMPLSVRGFVEDAVYINLLLAIFNMVPIPPLDGSRLVMGILPKELAIPYSRLEPYGILIVFMLLYMGVLGSIVFPVIEWVGKLLGIPLP